MTPKEQKSDLEILLDFRFYSKYGEYLKSRIERKSDWEWLGLKSGSSKSQIKKAYFKQCKIWHPDNIWKDYQNCFAH